MRTNPSPCLLYTSALVGAGAVLGQNGDAALALDITAVHHALGHGLINGDYKEMSEDDFRGILTLGGTILGTKRTPFKMMRVVEDRCV